MCCILPTGQLGVELIDLLLASLHCSTLLSHSRLQLPDCVLVKHQQFKPASSNDSTVHICRACAKQRHRRNQVSICSNVQTAAQQCLSCQSPLASRTGEHRVVLGTADHSIRDGAIDLSCTCQLES